ncbi:hypothetical protein J7F01_08870 [Streptomyces sp. ISL-22]|uniref:hypothetical protein n=1 Tax=unclassified Streptomyces TaxID=2593676 RepID=UPI001BE66C7D|nr:MULTISPECIES: hypothetical protein [unclassified Streptomyces]MBT2418011.1 hypothetical protein [Streptomyces sp. ISL-24]MBT2432314.1 hypothetical protein [Streptomyces sp. ISL-22]
MFGQGEFDQQELAANSDQIIGAGRDLWLEAVRVALVVAEIAAKELARRREQVLEQARKADARKIWEERQRAEPVLRAALSEDFWKDPTPQDIGRAWQTAMEWAQSDPEAAAVLEHMRDELESRYGLVPDDVQLDVADLSRALALGSPDLRAEAAEAREDAAVWGEISSVYVIRDPSDPERVLHRGELRTVPGESVEAASARALKEWAAANDRDLDGTIGIETFTNEDVPGRTPIAEVTGDRAQAVVDAEVRRQRRLVSGVEKGSLAEVHHAVYAELDRNEEAARLLGEGSEGYDDLREASKRLNLRAVAVEAEMRGEDPRYVYQAATLTSRLSVDEWWEKATPSQVAGVWEQVGRWPDSPAKTRMTEFLQDELFSRHGMDVENDTAAKTVAELLGGAESDLPAATYADRAADARASADEHFRKGFDAAVEAARLTREADQLSELPDADGRLIEGMRNRAHVLTGEAYAHYAQSSSAYGVAGQLEGRAAEHAERWDVEITPRNLREGFNRRWGRDPDLTAAASLAVSESGSPPGAARLAAPVATAEPRIPRESVRESGERDPEGASAVGVAAVGLPRSVQTRRKRVRAAAVPQPHPTRPRARSAGTGIG